MTGGAGGRLGYHSRHLKCLEETDAACTVQLSKASRRYMEQLYVACHQQHNDPLTPSRLPSAAEELGQERRRLQRQQVDAYRSGHMQTARLQCMHAHVPLWGE